MWKDNEYLINGVVVGSIYPRDPNMPASDIFPWAYRYNAHWGYIASSQEEARRQVERNATPEPAN